MKPPVSPGEILRELYLDPLGISCTDAARRIGCSRKHMSALLNGRARVTYKFAVKIAKAFGNEPSMWLALQSQVDLAGGR